MIYRRVDVDFDGRALYAECKILVYKQNKMIFAHIFTSFHASPLFYLRHFDGTVCRPFHVNQIYFA